MSDQLLTIPTLDLALVTGGNNSGVVKPTVTALLSLLNQEPLPKAEGSMQAPYTITRKNIPPQDQTGPRT